MVLRVTAIIVGQAILPAAAFQTAVSRVRGIGLATSASRKGDYRRQRQAD